MFKSFSSLFPCASVELFGRILNAEFLISVVSAGLYAKILTMSNFLLLCFKKYSDNETGPRSAFFFHDIET